MYSRRGKCLQCGKCCLSENCDHLYLNSSDGKYYCRIHNSKEYPIKCRLHPQAPPILIEGCGFYFYDKINDKILGVHEV